MVGMVKESRDLLSRDLVNGGLVNGGLVNGGLVRILGRGAASRCLLPHHSRLHRAPAAPVHCPAHLPSRRGVASVCAAYARLPAPCLWRPADDPPCARDPPLPKARCRPCPGQNRLRYAGMAVRYWLR